MLIHRGGRFFAGKSSFALPDGCRVNDAPLATLPNGINLKSEDEICTIDVNFEFGSGGARESLESSLHQEDFQDIRIKSRSYAGKRCWCAEYCGDLYKYFEARFDAPTGLRTSAGEEVNIFRILVVAPRNADIKAVRNSSVITELLGSFLP